MILSTGKTYTVNFISHQSFYAETKSGELYLIEGDWLSFRDEHGVGFMAHKEDIWTIEETH